MSCTHDAKQVLQDYISHVETHGPAGLDFLNARVAHRYTGIYRIAKGQLHCQYLYDKQREVIPEFLQVVSLEDSFCQFVLREGFFGTCDSANEPCLAGHKYRGVVNSYYGWPLLDNQGQLYGTLCHLDAGHLPLPEGEFELLQQVARLLPRYLLRQPSVIAQDTLL